MAESDFDSLDLVEATGADGQISAGMRASYTVRFASWDEMTAELLEQILRDAGSIRSAAKVIGVPRSTLGSWVSKKARTRKRRRGLKSKGDE